MSSVVQTRKTPPAEPAALTPPMTPPTTKTTTVNGSTVRDETPADLNLPDNYVAWTIKNQKELPPITFDNLFQNIQWISTAVLVVTPSVAIWGLLNVKLRWETFVWSVIYYFITGLGEYHFLLGDFGVITMGWRRVVLAHGTRLVSAARSATSKTVFSICVI